MDMYRPDVLDLIKEGMKDERHDNKKYRMLMEIAPTRAIAEQIRYAAEDEAKHYKMFQSIYKDLTGGEIDIPFPEVERFNICEGVKTSIDGELAAVELYRKIRAMLVSKTHRDMLYEIITDEQEHATRFTYVFATLCCAGMCK